MNVAYSKEFVDTSRKVSLEVKDTEVNKALTLLLKGTNIGFRFLDDSILFYNKEYQNKTEPVDSQGEKKELYVKGKVTDENAEPIIGATISVKGSTTGTITDINGQYSIKVPYGSTLRYSYVGYREESVIAKATTVNVVMKENAVSLEDVVVVGVVECLYAADLLLLEGWLLDGVGNEPHFASCRCGAARQGGSGCGCLDSELGDIIELIGAKDGVYVCRASAGIYDSGLGGSDEWFEGTDGCSLIVDKHALCRGDDLSVFVECGQCEDALCHLLYWPWLCHDA